MKLTPHYADNNIAIVMATDAGFVPYLYVALKSIVDNSSASNNYDITILYTSIDEYSKLKFNDLCRNNVSIRFCDVSPYMKRGQELWFSRLHYSIATYYRFFITEIFKNYSKVLYLDADIVVNSDIAELYNIEIGDNYVAAITDVNILMPDSADSFYVENILNIDPKKYFNAGVILFNIDKLRTFDFSNCCIETLEKLNKPRYLDQDVLNTVCKDHVKYLNVKYNMFWTNLGNPYFKYNLPQEFGKEFAEASKAPFIIHYATHRKPWKSPEQPYAEYFWKYARMTPYYEAIVQKNCMNDDFKETIKNVYNRKKIYLQYLKCKLLRSLTSGDVKAHYDEKAHDLKDKIRDYRQIIEEFKVHRKKEKFKIFSFSHNLKETHWIVQILFFKFTIAKNLYKKNLKIFKNYKNNNLDITTYPKATGRTRMLQLANLHLLKILDKVCKDNNIQYWLDFGTLLGAVRHGGPIPWDDDIDVSMMREDYEKVIDLINNNPYDPDIYADYHRYPSDEWTGNWFIIKILHKRCPHLFVDIFPYDYLGKKLDYEEQLSISKIAQGVKKCLLPKYSQKTTTLAIKEDTDNARRLFLADKSVEDNESDVIWGFDYLHRWNKWVYSHDSIFPLQDIKYENMIFKCVNNKEQFLTDVYGNYMSYPDRISDVHSIYQHIPSSELKLIEEIAKKEGF